MIVYISNPLQVENLNPTLALYNPFSGEGNIGYADEVKTLIADPTYTLTSESNLTLVADSDFTLLTKR